MIIGITSYLVITGALFSMDTLSNSLKTANEIENERLKTEIEIVEIVFSGQNKIFVKLNNTGSTKILNSKFEHIDVFVYYDVVGASKRYVFMWIPYTETSPPENDHWGVESISPDLINPGIFDPDEQMEIWIKVSNNMNKENMGWIKVVTPNAVSASKYFGG
jgi:flagellar protein FlaF